MSVAAMSDDTRKGGIGRAFQNRNFCIYTLGSIPSLIGTWVQRVAVGWLAWEMTHSATWLGAIAFADLFPVVVIGPFAGAFADRLDRLIVARILQILTLCQALALGLLTMFGLITIELLLALALFLGCLHAAFQPFRQSIIANLGSRDELPALIAVNSSVWHGSRFVGPAIAGLIIAGWGVVPAFLFNAVTYSSFIIALFFIRLPPQPRVLRSLAEVPGEIVEGVRYAFAHPGIRPILVILFAVSFLGRPVMELLPGFATEVFGRGPEGLAWLTSAAGLGAMGAGIWFAQWGRFTWLPLLVASNLAMLGVTLAAFAVTDIFFLAVPLLGVVGLASILGGIATQTAVQAVVADSMRGRVLSIYGMIWLGGPATGALVSGILADMIGLQWPVLGAAVLALACSAWGLGKRGVIATQLVEARGEAPG